MGFDDTIRNEKLIDRHYFQCDCQRNDRSWNNGQMVNLNDYIGNINGKIYLVTSLQLKSTDVAQGGSHGTVAIFHSLRKMRLLNEKTAR
jgi:hypothetical protein